MRIKQVYCSSALAHKLALEGEEEREKEREREAGSAGGLASSLRRLPGQEVGGLGWGVGVSSEGPLPSRGSGGEGGVGEEEEEWEEEEEEQAGGGQAALLWWRRVPEDSETLEAVRTVGGEQGGERPSSRGGRGGIPGCILWR